MNGANPLGRYSEHSAFVLQIAFTHLHLSTFYLRFTHTPWIHQEQLRVQHLA